MDALLPKKHRPRPYKEGDSTVIRIADDRYPPLLRHIAQPPQSLFIRGAVEALRLPISVAFVGTRKMTPYGSAATRLLAGPAARAGICIVSGLALGVDAIAHQAAIDAGGVTVAVLAGGIDDASITPTSHLALAHRIIASGGAIISEQPPGTPSHKYGFPKRNRIVAGMSQGTVVVEAAQKSGALITAYSALDANRDVYAVPGPITSSVSAGCHELLRRGAVPLFDPSQLAEAYGLSTGVIDPQTIADERERAVYACVSRSPKTADELAAQTGFSMREVLALTTALTLKNLLVEDRGTFLKN